MDLSKWSVTKLIQLGIPLEQKLGESFQAKVFGRMLSTDVRLASTLTFIRVGDLHEAECFKVLMNENADWKGTVYMPRGVDQDVMDIVSKVLEHHTDNITIVSD